MSTLKANTIEAADSNTDLTIQGSGTGVPNLETGFKVGGTAGVPTADIRNDAVTGAKLNPALVAGDIIYADGTDTINRLAKGTAAQVLQMNAGATAPEWTTAGGGGAWSYISGVTVTEVTNVDFTGLNGDYEVYMFQFGGIMSEDYADALHWRFGTGAGPTYVTTKHSFVYDRTKSGAATYIQAHAESGQYGIFCSEAGPGNSVTQDPDNPYGYYGHMYLMGHADSAQHARVQYTGSNFTYSGNVVVGDRIVTADGVGYYGETTNITAMRFFTSNHPWSSENSTTIKLYGLAPS